MNEPSRNKRLAKNTIIMYGRMLFVMALTLYTVRIALKILGIEDYGIYNVVAGLVTVMAFISDSLQAATQRYYSYALGEKDSLKSNRIFNLSLLIYIGIAIIVLILGETLGFWFINNNLTIPLERLKAANWIYQFALISFVFTVLSIPYSSMVIAQEDMGLYAGITIIESSLKLAILFLLKQTIFDKLALYGFLMLLIFAIKSALFVFHCKRNYSECYLKFYWDKTLFQSMLSYSGWTLLGTIAGVANSQVNNILINIFFGPIANAARAVAFQISTAMASFSSNLFIVLRPPIIKSYAEKNYEYMMKLFYMSSKFSYYLLYLLFLPLILETKFVLNIWLSEVGEYMVIFTRLVLIYSLIIAQSNPITAMIQATGKVKRYFTIVESVTLLSLPLTYLFYKIGYPAEYTFYISIFVFLLAHILRLFVLKTTIALSFKEYSKKFIIPVLMVSSLSSFIPVLLHLNILHDFLRVTAVVFATSISMLLSILIFGLEKSEKDLIKELVKSKLNIKR